MVVGYGFGKWNRDDDPADGPCNDWGNNSRRGGAHGGASPVNQGVFVSEQEIFVENMVGKNESEEFIKLRDIAEKILHATGEVSKEAIIQEIVSNIEYEELLDSLSTKQIDQILTEF